MGFSHLTDAVGELVKRRHWALIIAEAAYVLRAVRPCKLYRECFNLAIVLRAAPPEFASSIPTGCCWRIPYGKLGAFGTLYVLKPTWALGASQACSEQPSRIRQQHPYRQRYRLLEGSKGPLVAEF